MPQIALLLSMRYLIDYGTALVGSLWDRHWREQIHYNLGDINRISRRPLKPHTITEEILKESTDRILLALKHKGIDVKRPDFIIEHEVRERRATIKHRCARYGKYRFQNTTWNEFVKKLSTNSPTPA